MRPVPRLARLQSAILWPQVFGLAELTRSITLLNGIVPAMIQCDVLHQLRRNIRRACRCFCVIAIVS